MKKAYKVTWISLASILGVIILVAVIALYLILSPKRLTSLVNKYASEFITCDYNIGRVDLTLFKTFPDAGLEIKDVTLVNPNGGWTSDTLAHIDNLLVSVNLRKLLFGNEIIVNNCLLDGGFANVFFDTEGNSNIDIFPPSEPEVEEPETEESSSYVIDINKVRINDLDVTYTDLGSNIATALKGLGLAAEANIKDDVILGDIDLNINDIKAHIEDSTTMDAAVRNLVVKGNVKMNGDDINADANVGSETIAFIMSGEDNLGAYVNSLNVNYNGDFNNYEIVNGIINLIADGTTVLMDGEKYVDSANISLNIPVECNINEIHAKFDKSQINYNDISIEFIGEATVKDDITLNMDVHTNAMIINNIIRLIPERLRNDLLGGIKVNGTLLLNSHIEGTYNEEKMPVINADVTLNDGYFEMPEELPYPLTALNTDIHADLDLNGKSDVNIRSFRTRMNNTVVAASGTVKDVMDKMLCDMSVKADVDFDDIRSFLPEEMEADGAVKADVNVKGTLDQFTELDLMNTKLNGNMAFTDLKFNYYDTINVTSSDLKVDFVLPNPQKTMQNGLAQVKLIGSDLNADITGMMTAVLDDFNIDAQVSNVLDENDVTAAIADFAFNKVDFTMDDMEVHSNYGSGSAFMLPSTNDGNTSYAAVYNSDSLVFAMGDEMYFGTEALAVDLSADYDEREEDFILQWKPAVNLDLSNALFQMSDLAEDVIIPDIALTYGEQGLHIDNSQITLGNSDFELEGDLSNVYEHYKNGDLLVGEFNFTSNYTDINQLMDIFNGMGGEEEEAAVADSVAVEDDPFMVPLGVDIILHTNIKNALAGEMEIRNVGGDLTVKDGVLVLEQMGFTSDAAEMQLTALYKSKRKNHLYAGIDFHLLDIDIAEMIRIIPDLDTIVPMLKSFAGNAEFHFAAETNLKSDYSLKYSTLKAACSIEGSDLVVLDSETFNKIKKLLMFKKTTDNKIDSLDVQFTVFKNEIDVYPFAVSMDKYSAMLYGRHNLDMSYDYNIAVLNPPVLNRLGVEIKGPDFDNMKFKVRRSKHRNMFKPEKRDYKEEKIAELKSIISNSLKANVK
ncbi:MAG: hypothetical protein J6X10_06135 [Bacteroidales bacterium]|nr:hypothetical protein [Bacteroidales bacterium]